MVLKRGLIVKPSLVEQHASIFGQSKLPNGIRVASVNTPGPCVASGIMIETRRNAQLPPIPGNAASLYALEKLGFKATKNLTEQKMHAKLDELVGAVQAKAHRESILYSGAVVPNHLYQLLDLLREVVTAPLVTGKDLEELRSIVAYELEELRNKTDDLLPELAHGPAFYSNHTVREDDTIFMDWNSLVGLPKDQFATSVESILEYWKKTYITQSMVVVGAGLPHGELHNSAADTFGTIEKSPLSISTEEEDLNLKYVGGNNYIEHDELPLVHMVIGFKGAQANSPQAFPLAVLQMLMGGGSSFSAGGPGKGMYSRLYTQVLNRYHFIDACRVFNFSYSTAGLFGIHGSALPSHAEDLVKVLLDQLHSMTETLTTIELDRAKSQVKSAVLMGLESRMTELEDLADQVSYNKKYLTPTEVCEKIDALSGDDLRQAAKEVLSSKPTVVAYGPLYRVPSYDGILKWHQARMGSRR
jgi:processing peptidase subunit alpha